MKKIIFSILVLAMFVFVVLPVVNAQYTIGEYKDEVSYRGSLDPQLDPIYQIIERGISGENAGTKYYVDNNTGSDSDNGLSWDKAFLKISYAMAISHANIKETGKGRAANRNTIYVRGDDFDENLTKLAQKTDVIGVGSDDGNKGPRLLGNHTIDSTSYMGCRLINMTFAGETNTHTILLPTQQNGIEFICCTFEPLSNGQTYGIRADGCDDLVIKGCRFMREAGSSTGFATAAIDIGATSVVDLLISNNWIDAEIGIVVDSSANACLSSSITNNFIHATTWTIDENGDSIWIAGNTLISEAVFASGYDFEDDHSVGNILTGSDVTRAIPVVDKLDHLIAVADSDDPVDHSIIAHIASATEDWSTFIPGDDSLQAISEAIETMTGVGFRGTITTEGTTSQAISTDLTGFGADHFVSDYVVICTYTTDNGAPVGNIRDITGYVTGTGVFTVGAVFDAALGLDDRIMIGRREKFVDIAAILADTAAIEPIVTDITGLTEIGTYVVASMDANSTILTDIEGLTEIGDYVLASMDANSVGFTQLNLDHLMGVLDGTDADVVTAAIDSVIAKILVTGSEADPNNYDNTTMSLMAIAADATNSGTYLIITADVNNDAIPADTQASAAITGASTGALYLEDIIICTDANSWHTAAYVNLEISTNSATFGAVGVSLPFLVEAAASFTANSTFKCSQDGDTKIFPMYLADGSSLFMHGSDVAGDQMAIARVMMIFRRITDGATIAGADLGTIL